MSYTLATVAALQVQSSLTGKRSLLDALAQIDNPCLGLEGPVSFRYLGAPTVSATGTVAAEEFANTVVAGTRYNKRILHVVEYGEYDSPDAMDNLINLTDNAADGFISKATGDVIDALYAATPSHNTTLTAGGMNFSDVTDSEAAALIELAKWESLVWDVASHNRDGLQGMCAILHPTAWKNFLAIRSMTNKATGIEHNASMNVATWYGMPVYSSIATTTANFGAASKPCGFILHKNALGFVWAGMEVPEANGKPYIFNPYTSQWNMTFLGTYVIGSLSEDLKGEILNTTS